MNPKAGKNSRPSSKQSGRSSPCLWKSQPFCSIQAHEDWRRPTTPGRAIYFTQSVDADFNLTPKHPHRHAHYNVWPNAWAPVAPSRWCIKLTITVTNVPGHGQWGVTMALSLQIPVAAKSLRRKCLSSLSCSWEPWYATLLWLCPNNAFLTHPSPNIQPHTLIRAWNSAPLCAPGPLGSLCYHLKHYTVLVGSLFSLFLNCGLFGRKTVG